MKTKETNSTKCSSAKNTTDKTSKKKVVTEKEIEAEVEKMNPDKESMESRG